MKEGKKLTVLLVLLVLLIPVFLFLTHDKGIDENSVDYKLYELSKEKGYDKDYKKWEKAVEDGSLEYRIIDGEVQWNFSGDWAVLFTEKPEWFDDFSESDLYNNYYVIDFVTNSETQTLTDVEIKEGTKLTQPTLTQEEDMVVGGWYTEEAFTTKYNFDTNVEASFTLYAKWVLEGTEEEEGGEGEETTYTINYVLDGGDKESNPDTYTEGTTLVLEDATKVGYTFHGWYTDDTFVTSIDEIVAGTTGEVTVYAKFVVNEYTIFLNVNGGDSLLEELTVNYGEEFVLPTPTRDEHTFDGWYDNGSEVVSGTYEYLNDITLVAEWTYVEPTEYTITYELNGGTLTAGTPDKYEVATGVSNIPSASKVGNFAGGWYDNPEFTGNQITSIAANTTGPITLYAKFTPDTYKLLLATKTGEVLDDSNLTSEGYLIVTHGEAYVLPIPTKTGFTFDGWVDSQGQSYVDGIWDIVITGNGVLTLNTTWTIGSYTIDYNLGEGETTTNPTEFTFEQQIILSNAVKTGYDFKGWYDNAGFTGTQVTNIPEGTSNNVVLYPKFEASKYEITFNVNGGNAIANLEVTYDAEFTLPTPLFFDHTFTGWRRNGFEFVEGTYKLTENITISANWKEGNFDTYGNVYVSEGDDLVLNTGALDIASMVLPSVVNGRNVVRVNGNAFSGNTALESIEFSATIVSVGYQAFKGCTSLTTVTFAENGAMNKLFSESFNGCTSLVEITIPSTIVTIEGASFGGRSVALTVNVDFTEGNKPSTWSFPDTTIFNYATE